jgi:hypothetical protein
MAEEKAKKKAAPEKQAQATNLAGLPWGWLSVAFIFLFVIGFLASQLLFPPKTEVAEVTIPVTVEVLKEVQVTVQVTAPPEAMAEAMEESAPTEIPPTETPLPPPTQAPASVSASGLACTEVISVGHGSLGTLIVVEVPGVPDGTFPALINNYLDEECVTDPNYPDRLYCQTSRLAAGYGNIDISDSQGNLFCELKFTVP